MSGGNFSLTPDAAWVVGSVVTAAVAAGPAYIASRRSKTSARHEGEATRNAVTDALNQAVGTLHGRFDSLAEQLKDVQDWQAEHVTEHAVDRFTRSPRIELRRRDKP